MPHMIDALLDAAKLSSYEAGTKDRTEENDRMNAIEAQFEAIWKDDIIKAPAERQAEYLAAAVGTTARLIVQLARREPPQAPEPQVSLLHVSNGMEVVHSALVSMVARYLTEAESGGATLIIKPSKRSDRNPPTEDDAPPAGPTEGITGA